MSDITTISSRTDYATLAFEAELSTVWRDTPFWEAERRQMTAARAFACTVRDDETAAHQSRKLIAARLSGEFSDQLNDTLDVYYHQLPVANHVQKFLRSAFTQYNRAPVRVFGEAESDFNDTLQEIYAAGNIDKSMLQAVRSAGVSPAVLIRPIWRATREVIELQVILPDRYRVVSRPDDPKTATEIVYPVDVRDEKGRSETYLVHWTAEKITRYKAGSWGRVASEEDNPYGRLPFVPVRLREDGTYYGGGLWSLVEARMEANRSRFLADLNEGAGANPTILALNLGLDSSQITSAPGVWLTKDGVGDPKDGYEPEPHVEIINSPSEYNMVDMKRRDREKQTLRDQGVPASVIEDNPGQLPSGVARRVERTELLELREEMMPALRAVERELFEAVCLVIGTDAKGLYPSMPTETKDIPFSIDYEDEHVLMEVPDELAYDTERGSKGLMSLTSYVKKWSGIDREMTTEEAIEFVQRNKEDFQTAFANVNTNAGDEPDRGSEPLSEDSSATGGDEGSGATDPDADREDDSPSGIEDSGA